MILIPVNIRIVYFLIDSGKGIANFHRALDKRKRSMIRYSLLYTYN